MRNAVNTLEAPGALLVSDNSGAVVLLDTTEMESFAAQRTALANANTFFKNIFSIFVGVRQGFRELTRTGAWRLRFDGNTMAVVPLLNLPPQVGPIPGPTVAWSVMQLRPCARACRIQRRAFYNVCSIR